MNLEQLSFLTQQSIQLEIIELCSKKIDFLKLAQKLAKRFSIEERQAFMSACELYPLCTKKFKTNEFILCDRLAYEQSTAKDLSEWKIKKHIPKDAKIADLCCGMGGDSFNLKSNQIEGIDLSPERLLMFKYNSKTFKLNSIAIKNDVRTHISKADFFMLDPARRSAKGQSQWDIRNLSPNVLEIEKISKRYAMGMIKLGPGMDLKEINFSHSRSYLGTYKDCRELLVLTGELNKNNSVSAYDIETNFSLEYPIEELNQLKLDTSTIGKYLIEPNPAFIRSHLFPLLAKHHPLWMIDSQIAYLSSDKLPPKELPLTSYKLIDQSPIATKKVKTMLKKHDIGDLTIKKRGVNIEPASELKKLRAKGNLKGKKNGVIIYSRLPQGAQAFLCEKM